MEDPPPIDRLHQTRAEYTPRPLNEDDLLESPFRQFERWYAEAVRAELVEPNAMALSTVAEDGSPTVRTVLLKYFDTQGLVFFTNYQSRKARQIAHNARVALLFPWLPLHRQVEVNGRAERVSLAESAKYFATRPRGSQLGAWVSAQSSTLTSRKLLEAKLAEMLRKFAGGEIPIPSFWGGFRVVPHRFEFWQGQPDRLHDRFEYLRGDADRWTLHRLSP